MQRRDLTTTQRGYGGAHQALRARYAGRMAAGEVFPCTRCHQPVMHGMTWHLDHDDTRLAYLGPAHASCNTRAGARLRHARSRRRRALRLVTSRSW